MYELASKLKYAMLPLPMTVPYSLFSKMIMTICEKFGTRGRGVGVASIVGVGSGVLVKVGKGVRVGGESVGVDAKRVKASWQAEVKKEARKVIQMMIFKVFILASI